MSTDRDVTRTVRSWLEEGVTTLPDRVLDTVLDQLPATPQRRAGWPGRRLPAMNNTAKIAVAAAAVVAVALLGIRFLLPSQNVGPPGPTPIPTATPLAITEGELAAGTYTAHPFGDAGGGWGACPEPSGPDCDPTVAADISVTFTVPDGWAAFEPSDEAQNVFWLADRHASAPDGASFLIMRGSWLASDPCAEEPPDIPVGPSVDDFANALADHPLLDTTDPVDVTLDGYSGKYLDLQTPLDFACAFYRPWDPGIYAQGLGQRWHLWILDVDGIRIVIHADDYAGTSAEHQAELQAIVDSIQIEP